MDASRRGFLKGLLAAPAAGGLLVQPASASEVELFKPVIHEPVMIQRVSDFNPPLLGRAVFDGEGRVLGVVTQIFVEHSPVETTHDYYSYRTFERGPTQVRFECVAYGPVQIEIAGQRRNGR